MFISPHEYKDYLSQMVEEEESLDVAVAFWGKGAEKLIHPNPNKPIRMICNLLSGGTNPKAIQFFLDEARKGADISIRQCDRLHAKVMLGKRQALIGSANLSANGLGLEGAESAHWLEAAVLSRDASVVESARCWFEDLWQSELTREIKGDDIKAAIKAWELNRGNRPGLPGDRKTPFTLDKFTVDDLENRQAYALLYRSRLSEEAELRVEVERQALNEELKVQGGTLDWWQFESWPTPLNTTDPIDYIGIFCESEGEVTVDGASRMINKRLDFDYLDKSEGKGWVDLALATPDLLGRPFRRKEQKILAKQLSECFEEVWMAAEGSEWARTIHLADLAGIVKAKHSI